MVHDAANTIILQTRAAPDLGHHISYASWMLGTLMPMWIGVRMAARAWSAAWLRGRRRR